ncbi:hypothetical protein RRF57_000026 [Xylaria bambusicola]|uniref:Uncharacterized protein n=1 Tax=Xylaria bambusicola TaxID=326684 RepID=A0AAN7U344_9PEZI
MVRTGVAHDNAGLGGKGREGPNTRPLLALDDMVGSTGGIMQRKLPFETDVFIPCLKIGDR